MSEKFVNLGITESMVSSSKHSQQSAVIRFEDLRIENLNHHQ